MLGRLGPESRAIGPARVIALTIVPLGLLGLASVMREARGPYHLGVNSDPDYAYLTNMLNVVGQQPPDLYEHPGTTVEILGAVAILARWLPDRLISVGTSVQDAVLANPEVYLAAISTFFAFMVSVAVFAAGIQALRTWRRLAPAVTIQLSLLLFTQIPAALPRVAPEPLLIVAAVLLIAALIPLTNDAGIAGPSRWIVPLAVGTVMGFGLATKFTFLPLLGFVLLIPSHIGKAMALGACALGFIVFTLPVAVYYDYMRAWLETLATHNGVNGSGNVGPPDPGKLLENVASLVPVATPLFVLGAVYLILAVSLLFSKMGLTSNERGRMRNLFAATGLVFIAQIALTAKQPSGHYLLPAMAASGLAAAGVIKLLTRAAPVRSLMAVCRAGFVAASVVGLIIGASRDYEYLVTARAYSESTAAFERQTTVGAAKLIAYYGSSQVEYALAFGNDFARNRYDARLRELYPDALFYSIWERRFYSFAGTVPSEEIRRLLGSGRTVLMYGFPLRDGYAVYQKGLTLEPVSVGSDKAVYRLLDIDTAQANVP